MLFVNNSESKISKFIAMIFAISALIGLTCQVTSFLALTKTKLGKKIRHNVISTMSDTCDEFIDEAVIRAPRWMEKLSKIDQ